MREKIIFISVIILSALILYIGSISGWFLDNDTVENDFDEPIDAVSEATENRYLEREIRGYQGMRLDPSVGPRDNSITGIQHVDLDDYTLQVTGLVSEPVTYTYEQVLEKDSYQRLITLYCVEGWDATILWEGVRLMELIEDAGIVEEEVVVIFHAVDGYTTSMPLETIRERDMLLAYSSNGITLPPNLGFPFMVVAEDKFGYKWARWVFEIELSSDLEYEGFWESRGFSNEAELDDH